MNGMRILGVVLALFASGARAQTAPLGLSELVELAETGNFSRAEGRLNRERSEWGVTQSRSKLLPRLLFESSAAYGSQSDEWTSNASLVLRQNLFDGGQNWSAFRRSRLSREQSELQELRSRESMTLTVLKAFTDCSRLESSRAASKRKLELLGQQFDQVRRQFRQGLKTQRDYQLLEAELERSRLELETLENSIFKAYRDLESVLGTTAQSLDPSKLKLLSAERILSLKNWSPGEASFDPAKENLELRALRLTVEDRELALGQIRLQYFPVLSVDASAAYGTSAFLGPRAVAWSENAAWNLGVGLNLSWTLWDWGGVPAQVSLAKADQLIESKRFEQKALELKNDFNVLMQNVQRQARVLEVQRKIRSLERKSFQDIEKEYREGRSNYLDLISALGRDITAELSYENEAFAYFVAVAELLELKGNLYESTKNL